MISHRRAICLLLLLVVLSAATDQVLGRTSTSDTVIGERKSLATGLRKVLWKSSPQAWNSYKRYSSPSISSDDEWRHLILGSSVSVSLDDHGREYHQQKHPQKQRQEHATRFASIHDLREAREITLTIEPHLKKQEKHGTRNCRHTNAKFAWSRMHSTLHRTMESVLLSHDYDEDAGGGLDGEPTNCSGVHDKRNWVVPCSARPVALQQGRGGLDKSRRLTPSFSTKKSTDQAKTSKIEPSTFIQKSKTASVTTLGGNSAAAAAVSMTRPLLFWENMVSGAVSRSVAQTVMHPANTMKTILQSSRGPNRPTLGDLFQPQMFRRLTRGAGANFALSIPHGAVNFAVLEFVRGRLNRVVESVPFLDERKEAMGPGLDFLSSAISTICCSVVSTPQMMVTDVSPLMCYVASIEMRTCRCTGVSHVNILLYFFFYVGKEHYGRQLPQSCFCYKRVVFRSGHIWILHGMVAWTGRQDSQLRSDLDFLPATQEGPQRRHR
jgi:hypothetical protein